MGQQYLQQPRRSTIRYRAMTVLKTIDPSDAGNNR